MDHTVLSANNTMPVDCFLHPAKHLSLPLVNLPFQQREKVTLINSWDMSHLTVNYIFISCIHTFYSSQPRCKT